jgi:hypothetical protein
MQSALFQWLSNFFFSDLFVARGRELSPQPSSQLSKSELKNLDTDEAFRNPSGSRLNSDGQYGVR